MPAACVAVLLGTMASMYTVWFGFVYSILWTLTLAMTVTMRQMIAGAVKQDVRSAPQLQPYATPGRGSTSCRIATYRSQRAWA